MDQVEPLEQYIQGIEAIIPVFGEWPDFHDGEVISVELEREKKITEIGPTLTMKLACRSSSAEWHEVTLSFGAVKRLQMSEFNYQNAINQLFIERVSTVPDGAMFNVEVIPGSGFEARFKCERIKVLSIVPHRFTGVYW